MDLLPQLAVSLLTPPGAIILAGGISMLVYIWKPFLGSVLFGASLAALFMLSLPVTGHQLLVGLERDLTAIVPGPVAPGAGGRPDAIVVLGGGRYSDAPEFGNADTISRYTLERLRYAAGLHRLSGIPILVTGGKPHGESRSEAELMQQVLTTELFVPVRWIEDQAANTRENARYSQAILQGARVRRIYLVTHAWHMRRAQTEFMAAGLDVVPAPMGFDTLGNEDRGLALYLPSARGLYKSGLALRERLALRHYQTPANPAAAAPAK